MSFLTLLIDSVEITTPTSTVATSDRYGNPQLTTVVNTYAARVQQLQPQFGGGEDLRLRDTRVSTFTVFLPAGAVVDGLSTILWEGRTLRVDGEPATVQDGVGGHHIELKAEEILG
jgi:hypothetical protein